MRRPVRLLSAALLFAPASFAAGQAEERFALGARVHVVTAGGEPANDILSLGVFGRVRLSADWLLGFAVDQAEYDFEVPTRVLGLAQPPEPAEVIDAPVSSTIVSAWIEREYGPGSSTTVLFWGVGAGVAFVEVDDAAGPLAGGGTFDITTDPGAELIASGVVGFRWRPGSRIFLELAGRVDHHFSEWEVEDRVSGRTGATEDYTGFGGHLGLGLRF
jgi:hypothetical protein